MCRRGSMAGTGEVSGCTAPYGRAMQRSAAGTRLLVQAAALARIDELGGRMASLETADTADDPKATARAMWALGDYHRFAKQTVWDYVRRHLDPFYRG